MRIWRSFRISEESMKQNEVYCEGISTCGEDMEDVVDL